MSQPHVSIYIPCHNYGRFLEQAIQSVIAQSYPTWELIVIDDGSQDETAEVIARFKDADPSRIIFISHKQARGLQYSANEALKIARGNYIMRLDADDYLDDNALLVMVNYLDQHPDVALVYPNYMYVDEAGNILGVENRKRVGREAKVLDLPAHGACTMVRKRVLKSIGGYNEIFDRQDGYELWLKVLHRYQVGNISTPLFYYRQHENSITQDEEKLLAVRARIKRFMVESNGGAIRPSGVAIIGAKNTYKRFPNIVLTELAGKRLLDYTVDAAMGVAGIDSIVVTTDDENVVKYCRRKYPRVTPLLRSAELSSPRIRENEILEATVKELEKQEKHFDMIIALSVHCPLRQFGHIQKAIDTLLLYNVDSIISVYEDQDLHYVHGKYGLEELNPTMHRQIRVEREALYVDNGAIRVIWRDILQGGNSRDRKVGHVIMSRKNSIQIKNVYDAWMIEKIIKQRQSEKSLIPATWNK